jgi:two-component system, chemotaxis family, chemotaxis protein CheY
MILKPFQPIMPNMSMAKTVVLAGHCGPDSSYLKLTVKKAIGEVILLSADDSRELTAILENGEPDLILLNRELGYGFEPDTGVEMIATLRRSYPNLKMILITNFQEIQRAAEAAGGLPGFGKRELGTPRVHQVLREALNVSAVK